MAKTRLQTLELLVDELLKESPEPKNIRERMSEAGLRYSSDPVEQMNAVLEALNQTRRTRPQSSKGRFNEQDIS
jgi:hypothetical protein